MNKKMDLEILSAQSFFVGRRDISFYSKEEIIIDAINEKIPIEKFDFLSTKDRETITLIRESKKKEIQFSFFDETESPFSMWYKTTFTSSILFHQGVTQTQKQYLENTISSKELKFSSVGQFMMYHKAIIFLDRDVANCIMSTSNNQRIMKLGKQIKNYDDNIWSYYKSNVVYMANYLKFNQNPELISALVDTIGTTLVKVASDDKIWGIGLSKNDLDAKQRETWKGKNLLGEILTLLRMEFIGIY